jgi:tRNA (mo5U34)-methyltransferase
MKPTASSSGITWWHRIKLPDGTFTPGIVRHGPDGGDWPATRFGVTEELVRGRTVHDIGTWDGFFAFEAERLGATHVRATDATQDEGGTWAGTAGFLEAHRLLGSKVEHGHLNIQDADEVDQPANKADVVFLFGVLYHLTAPDTGLAHAASLAKHTLLIETAGSKNRGSAPVLEYLPGLGGDPTNFYYPNPSWVAYQLAGLGFATAEVIHDSGARFTMRCTRA